MLGIIGAAAVIGIVESIAPHNAKTAGYMKLITSLCLLCVVIKPLSGAVTQIPALFEKMTEAVAEDGEARREYEEILQGEMEEAVRGGLSDGLREQLRSQFGIENCEIGIALERTDGTFHVTRVIITLTGKDIFRNPHTVEAYVKELFECECVVVIG